MAAAGGQASDIAPHASEHTEKETPINHMTRIFPYLFRCMPDNARSAAGRATGSRNGHRRAF